MLPITEMSVGANAKCVDADVISARKRWEVEVFFVSESVLHLAPAADIQRDFISQESAGREFESLERTHYRAICGSMAMTGCTIEDMTEFMAKARNWTR